MDKLSQQRAEKEAERRERSKRRRASLLSEISSEVLGKDSNSDRASVNSEILINTSLMKSFEKVDRTLLSRRPSVASRRIEKEEQRKRDSRERRRKLMKDIADEIGIDGLQTKNDIITNISRIDDQLEEKRNLSCTSNEKTNLSVDAGQSETKVNENVNIKGVTDPRNKVQQSQKQNKRRSKKPNIAEAETTIRQGDLSVDLSRSTEKSLHYENVSNSKLPGRKTIFSKKEDPSASCQQETEASTFKTEDWSQTSTVPYSFIFLVTFAIILHKFCRYLGADI